MAGGQDYEVRYESKKTGRSASAVKKAIKEGRERPQARGEATRPLTRKEACPGAGFLRSRRHLSFTLSSYDIRRMDGDYDPEREAEAAMKLAVATDGLERQRWISLATAWQEFAGIRAPSKSGAEEAA